MKELTRGRKVNQEMLREFIEGLDISDQAKSHLASLTTEKYTGLASKLVDYLD